MLLSKWCAYRYFLAECHDRVNNFWTERCMYNRRLCAGKIKLGPPFNNRFALSKSSLFNRPIKRFSCRLFNFFSIWVFFHKHSRFTIWQQRNREAIYLIPFYHFYLLHKAITADSSPLHIDSSWTRIGNL